jgi:hypothetical protein
MAELMRSPTHLHCITEIDKHCFHCVFQTFVNFSIHTDYIAYCEFVAFRHISIEVSEAFYKECFLSIN